MKNQEKPTISFQKERLKYQIIQVLDEFEEEYLQGLFWAILARREKNKKAKGPRRLKVVVE